MTAFEKLFIARTLLTLNQKEAAEQAGIHPASLSILERGEKKYIPTEYLHFLHTKGIDINWIFGDSNSTNAVFRIDAEQAKAEEARAAARVQYQEGSIQSILASNNHLDTKVIIHKHTPMPDTGLKEILEELKKLNTNLSIAQSSVSNAYGN